LRNKDGGSNVLIPYTHTTTEVVGSTLNFVTCEKCGTAFHCAAKRSAAGDRFGLLPSARGYRKSEEAAYRKLQRALGKAVDLVACPSCRWFQSDMIRAKRRKILLICLLCAFTLSWPMIIIYALVKKGPVMTESFPLHFFMMLGGTHAVALVAAAALCTLFRPNKGSIFPCSKKGIDRGEVTDAAAEIAWQQSM
jgi:hypothetical protein